MKNRTLRTAPLSNRWLNLVLNTSNVESTKQVRQSILEMWLLGYSFKDAAIKIKSDCHE